MLFDAPDPKKSKSGVFDAPKGKAKGHAHSRARHNRDEVVTFTRVRSENPSPIVYLDKSSEKYDRTVPVFEDDFTEVPNTSAGTVFSEGSAHIDKNGQFRYPMGSLRKRARADVGFRRARGVVYGPKVETFVATNGRPLKANIPPNILPDIALYSSAEGLYGDEGMFGMGNIVDTFKNLVSSDQAKALMDAGKTAYNAVQAARGKEIKKVANQQVALEKSLFQDGAAPATTTTTTAKGMSTGTMLLIGGGALAAVAVVAILLKRRS